MMISSAKLMEARMHLMLISSSKSFAMRFDFNLQNALS